LKRLHTIPYTCGISEGEDGGDPTGTTDITTTARALEGRVRHPCDVQAPRDGEWAGYNAVVCLAAAASIVVIDNDEGGDGGASADVKGKAPL
jgi:hypothetical protein